MLIDVGKGRWINTDKILLINVGTDILKVSLEDGLIIDLRGDDILSFLRLMNKAAVQGKPFPEVS